MAEKKRVWTGQYGNFQVKDLSKWHVQYDHTKLSQVKGIRAIDEANLE